MVLDPALLAWLLDADPALRWQVERDVAGAPPDVWTSTRARVATEGFGARLLALQDPDGQWAGGAYFPSGFEFHVPEATEDAGPAAASPTGRGCRTAAIPDGSGSKSTCRPVSRPSGSRSTALAYSRGGRGRPSIWHRSGGDEQRRRQAGQSPPSGD